jgi:hypothetical protein
MTYATTDSISSTGSVPSTTPTEVFETERWDPGSGEEMNWEFPVEGGETYEVRLYFAEVFHTSDGQREFDVSIEGDTVLDGYDIHAAVGHDTATVQTFTVTSDSTLDVDLRHVTGNPKLSAIEIVRVDGAGNTAPSIEPIADRTVTEGDSLDVPVTASDADGDSLSLSLSQAPEFVALDDNDDGTGTISVDPEPGDSGTYTVEVVADDGTDTTTESVTLTVDDGTPAEQTIEIVGSGEYTEYEFEVSGEVTSGSGLNPADSFSGDSASGTVVGGSDTYTFTGELTNLSVDGSATVRIQEGE